MKTDIMSLMFDNITMEQAVARVQAAISDKKRCLVVTPNAEIAYLAKGNADVKKIINQAELVLPDGIGVVLAAKIIGKPIIGRVPGVEFGDALCKNLTAPMFFLGGKPGVAQLAAENIKAKYPSCNIVGVADGYFKDADAVVAQVNSTGAEVLFVCLGAPRQEIFAAQNGDKLMPYVIAGLGGSLDVFAGTVKRAPVFFQKLGLEWLYRLIKQPSRIKRMAALPLYMWDSVVYRIRGGKNA